MGEVIKADLYNICNDENIPWDNLKDSAVLVTGATGLIGGALIGALSAANSKHHLNMGIIGHGRNKARGELLSHEYGAELIYGDIRAPISINHIDGRLDYVFHCAAITQSAEMVAKPVEVMWAAALGTKNMLELALKKQCWSFVYLSSMEVYGQTGSGEVRESDLGYLDLSAPRSSYPESKRYCEMLCSAYHAQHGLPLKIARLAQTFGAGTPQDDGRVFAQFARSAMAGEDIVLHTEGKSRGNYCYISDAVRGLLTLLLKGEDGEAYNIAHPAASMTIREMAELVADEICDGKIQVTVKIPDDIDSRGYAPDAGYVLNTDKVQDLGWMPKHGLAAMYRRLMADWDGR